MYASGFFFILRHTGNSWGLKPQLQVFLQLWGHASLYCGDSFVFVTFSIAASLCFIVMLEWIHAAFRLAGRPDSYTHNQQRLLAASLFKVVLSLYVSMCERADDYLVIHKWDERRNDQSDAFWSLIVHVRWELVAQWFTHSCGQHDEGGETLRKSKRQTIKR